MIVKIVLCGVCVCVLNSVLRGYNKSFVIFTEIAFAAAIISLILSDAVKGTKSLSELLIETASQKKIIACLMKGAAICILTKLACDISYESGNILVGDIIELSGRILILIISLPFIESVVKTAMSFAL